MKKWMIAIITVLVLLAAAGVTAGVVLFTGDDDEEPEADETSETPEPDEGDATDDATYGELEDFYEQEIDWSSCGSYECGKLTVPVDYADPAGATIELNLSRVEAAGDDPVGSLVVNPGGPGAPGSDMVEAPDAVDFYFEPALQDAFDIVAFDPRGTGESAPIDCLSDSELDEYMAEDPTPDDPGERPEFFENTAQFWAGCEENTGEILGHVSTIEAARDMDVLRAALGEEQLHYLGFSYGTRLGATYAELFPEQVGRFVLDAAINPQLDFLENSVSQAAGFEVAIRSYIQDCVDKGSCFLGDTVQDGLGTITTLLEQIDDEPLPTYESRDLTIGYAVIGLITPLYNHDFWPALDQALQQALDGDGSTLLRLSDAYGSRENGSYTDNSLESISVINCLDDPSAIKPGETESYLERFAKDSPTIGDLWAWGLSHCGDIPVKSSEEPIEIHAEGAAPIIVVGTTRDPATPYEEAVALADQLESGILLTRDGDGHAAYGKGNTCVDDTIHALLVDGEAPDGDVSC